MQAFKRGINARLSKFKSLAEPIYEKVEAIQELKSKSGGSESQLESESAREPSIDIFTTSSSSSGDQDNNHSSSSQSLSKEESI